MSRNRLMILLLSLANVSTASLLLACARPAEEAKGTQTEPRVESTAAPSSPALQFGLPTASPSVAKASPTPRPNTNEVREAVARIFEKTVAPDVTRTPGFLIGDFNGDGSEDLAVLVKTNEGSLETINNELANWTLEDPRNVATRKTGAAVEAPPKPVRAVEGETLLAIIHGVGSQGWRSPEARQTFLLKYGIGNNMSSLPTKNLRNGKDKQKLPSPKGDAISETIGGKSGFVIWTGAKYAWYLLAPE